ncbi:MAG: suppressor of fused domain protein [Bacteroidales bacterium]|nr:suppressor of fused domain protein [Lachnoclostridium sp.]MCM1385418.1 suppressor of fused domain protein [Lachnoclostridium sp.]MCM1464100.1 suppressor of fused domain protein [Bacteroidales bacterium]
MGLFDMFKGKNKETAKSQEEEIPAPGWDAITDACKKIYPTQDNPKHYGTLIKWILGGPDPLDGISIYDGGDYWHFVTFGLSELYEKETKDKKISGYGMEFTFKLKKDNYEDEEREIQGICGILQSIARLTFNNGEIFRPYEYVYSGQTEGIDTKMKSNITGFITIPDKELESIKTPYGKVDFVEFIGATDAELKAVMNKELRVKELYEKIGSDVTNYNRQSAV